MREKSITSIQIGEIGMFVVEESNKKFIISANDEQDGIHNNLICIFFYKKRWQSTNKKIWLNLRFNSRQLII